MGEITGGRYAYSDASICAFVIPISRSRVALTDLHCAWSGSVSLHPFTDRLAAVHEHGGQAVGRKEPKLGGGSLLVIFPTSPKRVISLLPPYLSQRDKGRDFKFGNWFRREATEPIPKLNGCSDTLPPHAQWEALSR